VNALTFSSRWSALNLLMTVFDVHRGTSLAQVVERAHGHGVTALHTGEEVLQFLATGVDADVKMAQPAST